MKRSQNRLETASSERFADVLFDQRVDDDGLDRMQAVLGLEELLMLIILY